MNDQTSVLFKKNDELFRFFEDFSHKKYFPQDSNSWHYISYSHGKHGQLEGEMLNEVIKNASDFPKKYGGEI